MNLNLFDVDLLILCLTELPLKIAFPTVDAYWLWSSDSYPLYTLAKQLYKEVDFSSFSSL